MANLWLFAVVTFLSAGAVFGRPTKIAANDYSGYKVLRLTAVSENAEAFKGNLKSLTRDFDVDVWSRTANSADVMVAPDDLTAFDRAAAAYNLTVKVSIPNVQGELDREFAQRMRTRAGAQPDITDTFLRYDEINEFINTVAATATAADVTVGNMGKSWEGRDVNYVKIQQKGSSRQKFAIAIDGGIHAREWISPSMALNVIQKLALNPENDPDVQEMLEKFDWYVAPIVNPDGYEWSHRQNQRMWRKSRTTVYTTIRSCEGVDLNRNFGFDWNPDWGGSRNPCSDVFSGSAGFSEPETSNVRDWLTGIRDRARLYLNLHSYGEYMLYPYGSNPYREREEEDLLIAVGNAFADTMKAKGRNYIVGNSAEVFYIAAGGADDYAKGGLGISLSYTPELSPNDADIHGSNWQAGFMLPEKDIKPVVNDTWGGLKAMVRRVFQQYGYP